MRRLADLLLAVVSFGVPDGCDDDVRTVRQVFVACALGNSALTPIWGSLLIYFGEIGPGLVPFVYPALTLPAVALLPRVRSWWWFPALQIALVAILPFALMLSLGGYVLGSAAMVWAIQAPMGALWAGRPRLGRWLVAGFLAGAVISGLVQPLLRDSNGVPDTWITVFFVMNFCGVGGMVVLLFEFYMTQQTRLVRLLRRNRELESASVAQRLAVMETDKLATLGRLSAGLAHEMNNPASAIQQAVAQLAEVLHDKPTDEGDVPPSTPVDRYRASIGDRARHPQFLDPLDRSDREDEVDEVLTGAGVADGHLLAPALVGLGLGPADVVALSDELGPERLAPAVHSLVGEYRQESLLHSLDESVGRIVALVRALKNYTFLDRAPRQSLDVHEGLDSTLVMLQNRLKLGIEVVRRYGTDLPMIEAFGSELNQVWTNIITNAIDAMKGTGVLTITTARQGDMVVIEINDTGPGIPPDLAAEIFEPFVTTKPHGDGMGIGLNITRGIVNDKHGGRISVESVPGDTTFTIELPLVAPRADGEDEPATAGSTNLQET